MTPWEVRDLPRHRKIELIGHRREHALREGYSQHVREIVGKMREAEEKKK